MRCPRCDGHMEMQDLFTGEVHATVGACLACGGQWMRDSDLARLATVVDTVVVELASPLPAEIQNAPLGCPECGDGQVMKKGRSARDERVVFDQCERCGGVWLDTNELQLIQRESLWRVLAGAVRRPDEQGALA